MISGHYKGISAFRRINQRKYANCHVRLFRKGQNYSSAGWQYAGWIQGYFKFINDDPSHMTDDQAIYWNEPSM